jgi:hypothetical protein
MAVFNEFSRGLMVFDPSTDPTYLVVLMTQSGGPSTNTHKILISVFDLPSLSLKNLFSVDTPALSLDADLRAHFSTNLGKLIFYGQRKESACYSLSVIDIEQGVGTSQLLPNLLNLVYVERKDWLVAITVDGWVQCKPLREMELKIAEHDEGQRAFDGRTCDTWASVGWKKLIHIPPSFLPGYESGLAVHEKGELAYVCDLGKQLVQISFEW